jgi:hypothetical protein
MAINRIVAVMEVEVWDRDNFQEQSKQVMGVDVVQPFGRITDARARVYYPGTSALWISWRSGNPGDSVG